MIVQHTNFLWTFFHVIVFCLPLLLLGMLLEFDEGAMFISYCFEKLVNFFDKIIDRFIK